MYAVCAFRLIWYDDNNIYNIYITYIYNICIICLTYGRREWVKSLSRNKKRTSCFFFFFIVIFFRMPRANTVLMRGGNVLVGIIRAGTKGLVLRIKKWCERTTMNEYERWENKWEWVNEKKKGRRWLFFSDVMVSVYMTMNAMTNTNVRTEWKHLKWEYFVRFYMLICLYIFNIYTYPSRGHPLR